MTSPTDSEILMRAYPSAKTPENGYKYLINYITPQHKVFLEQARISQLVKKFPDFMKPEVSLLYSQKFTNGPYHYPVHIFHINIIPPPTLRSPKYYLPMRLLNQNDTCIFPSYMLHDLPISFNHTNNIR
jgi:hypothetical protein